MTQFAMLQTHITLINILAAIIIVTIKEFTKALISSNLGDPLPKRDGRVTLNPFAHIEVIGLILIAFAGGFGWGKPVETSSIYYKNRKNGVILTSVVPLLVLFVFSLIFYYIGFSFSIAWFVDALFIRIGTLGTILFIWNLIPIHPFEGSRFFTLFMSPNRVVSLASMEKTILILLIILMFMWPMNPLTGIPSTIAISILRFIFGLVIG